MPPGASALREVRRQLNQRPGKDVGDDQVERCPRGEHRRVHAVRDREQQLAGTVPELHAIDRRIVARDLDRDRVDVGGDAFCLRPQAIAAKASRPVPVPMSTIFAKVKTVALEQIKRFEAARRRRMLAGAEGEAGVDLEIDRVRIGARWVGVWTKKRPARIGCKPDWLIVTQSASPSCSRTGAPLPRLTSSAMSSSVGWLVEISVDQPVVGLGRVGLVGDQHRRARRIRECRRCRRPPRPARGCMARLRRQLNHAPPYAKHGEGDRCRRQWWWGLAPTPPPSNLRSMVPLPTNYTRREELQRT